MPFLAPKQQRESTESINKKTKQAKDAEINPVHIPGANSM